MSLTALALSLAFLLGSFFLQATSSGFRSLEQRQSREQLRATEAFFFYRSLQRLLWPKKKFAGEEFAGLFFCVSFSKHLIRLGYAISAILFLASVSWPHPWLALPLGIAVALLASVVMGDFLPRSWGVRHSEMALKLSAPFASLYLLVALPLTYPVLLLTGRALAALYLEELQAPVGQVKDKIMEMLQEAEVETRLDESEKQLLEGVASFRDRIVREVMQPRVDIVALSITTRVREAAQLFEEEGYSRIPVYKETIDQVVGLLMYKDLLPIYLKEDPSALDQTIEAFLKPIIYVPETSRVTHLLQELRQKQTHMAVVVDEYGGTEGIVTLEDCLEEIVGEIEDETDEEEEELYVAAEGGGWIVDGRMPILEIAEEFEIEIPQEGDYDTIGGYAFHRAGEIPTKGLKIRAATFDLEIIEVTERQVVKVRITPNE